MAAPGTFKSGPDIKLALSAAFSTQFNTRSLEANFCPVWISTLKDALAFSSRFSVATESYLTIPGRVIDQMQHSEKYKDLIAKQEKLASTEKNLPSPERETTNRRSHRVKAFNLEQRRKNQEIGVMVKQATMEIDDMVKSMVSSNDDSEFQDLSMYVESDHDDSARDSRPDISVAHIIGGSIRVPTQEDAKKYTSGNDDLSIRKAKRSLLSQYTARAGIKVVHRCTPLIGEFKRVTGRAGVDIANVESSDMLSDSGEVPLNDADDSAERVWPDTISADIVKAIDDLMLYTAKYFLIHPLAKETVALASSGPFWKWACFGRNQVPKVDWLKNEFLQGKENDELRASFTKQFGRGYYVLASARSDIEVNKMTKEICRITNNCERHLPTLPKEFDFKLLPDTPCNLYHGASSDFHYIRVFMALFMKVYLFLVNNLIFQVLDRA